MSLSAFFIVCEGNVSIIIYSAVCWWKGLLHKIFLELQSQTTLQHCSKHVKNTHQHPYSFTAAARWALNTVFTRRIRPRYRLNDMWHHLPLNKELPHMMAVGTPSASGSIGNAGVGTYCCRRAAANRLQPTKQQKQNIQSAEVSPRFGKFHCFSLQTVRSHCIRLCSLHNWTFLPLLLIYQANRHTDLFVPEENTHSCCLLKCSRSNRFGFLHHTVSSCAVYGCFKAESIGLKGLSGESHFL